MPCECCEAMFNYGGLFMRAIFLIAVSVAIFGILLHRYSFWTAFGAVYMTSLGLVAGIAMLKSRSDVLTRKHYTTADTVDSECT